MAGWTLFTSIVAAVFAVVGVIIMWRQFVVARESALGRGLQVHRECHHGVCTHISVAAAGPGLWTDFTGHQVDAQGVSVAELWPIIARYTNEHPVLSAPIHRPDGVGWDDCNPHPFVVLSWHQASGNGLRLMAARVNLEDGRTELFRWYGKWVIRVRRWVRWRGSANVGRWRPVGDGNSPPVSSLPGMPKEASTRSEFR
ncbi:hypothetical protein O4159_12355 [Gordonia terrae]|uniref:hypothetical protein n=1 Tax=Gordonia hongkongensis TaxID=1701090 RepID=UPI0022B3EF4D|nr:hypothetical protein [Gordonia terrae]